MLVNVTVKNCFLFPDSRESACLNCQTNIRVLTGDFAAYSLVYTKSKFNGCECHRMNYYWDNTHLFPGDTSLKCFAGFVLYVLTSLTGWHFLPRCSRSAAFHWIWRLNLFRSWTVFASSLKLYSTKFILMMHMSFFKFQFCLVTLNIPFHIATSTWSDSQSAQRLTS